MLSYNNDENLKNLVVSEMKRHQEQDQIIKGTYGEINGKFKGCAVGCTIDSINIILGKSYNTASHKVLEESIGVPEWLNRLQDVIFEGLPHKENSQFAVDFLSSIPVGINLEPVKFRFFAFILKEKIERVLILPKLSDGLKRQVVNAIRGVLNLYELAINIDEFDCREVESAAWAAARSARSVAESAAEPVVWAAARSAESAAESAAWAASLSEMSASSSVSSSASSEAWAAMSTAELVIESVSELVSWVSASSTELTRSASYRRYADELIKLLKSETLIVTEF